ncbi:MAG: MBL fold metallo-hydrolase [Deltaproteobacteria bacterium]|nr:MAG: MBL fold metallo-hydrolase [Deltaproteobacteria bacterium]
MNQQNPLGERAGLETLYPVEPPEHVRAAAGRMVLTSVPFGDPMAAIRLDRQKRWLFFDVGSFAQVPARTAHQISDIFISHTHVDHVCGFPWLLGRRINCPEVCRVYGPPGLAGHFNAMTQAFVWDRLGDKGPEFSIAEVHSDRLDWFHFKVGQPGYEQGASTPIRDGILLQDPLFQVRATYLDHGIPVLAYAYEERNQYHFQQDRREALGIEPGAWIADLQKLANAGEWDALVTLPNGSTSTVRQLIASLMDIRQGYKIVYATDFGDTPANRSVLTQLAANADLLVCETSYLQEDEEHAIRTGHMTAKACAEIAQTAQVHSVLPFHFSNRYVDQPERLYAEVASTFPKVEIPHELREKLPGLSS